MKNVKLILGNCLSENKTKTKTRENCLTGNHSKNTRIRNMYAVNFFGKPFLVLLENKI